VATDFDRTALMLGPFGSARPETCTIMEGKCFKDSTTFSADDVKTIAKCALKSFDAHIDRTFFWTAHNEITERWDYVRAWDLGWLNKTISE
jgi:hypothetical protein